ncbi:MAG: guanine deaminase [Candidatus Obscuribacterales bacterium]|nr:guanine deaminase [Candidatus Obscuribacterales bacterium]
MIKQPRFKKAILTALTMLVSMSSLMLPAQAADDNLVAVRGSFFDFTDDPWKHIGHEEESARFFADGMLVIDNGIIKAFGPYSEIVSKYPKAKVTTIQDRLILPGFIDGHVHFPQTRVLGAYGQQLLPWLQQWIFPEETKYKDPTYAKEGVKHYFDNMLAGGTTTVLDYGTAFPTAVEAFFDEAGNRNMRVICGIGGIDRNVPKTFMTPPDMFYTESKRLIEKYHGKGRNLYAITPRFAYGDSPELLQKCSQLHKEFPDCWVNTHISENPTETRSAPLEHGVRDYLGCYEKYGLVGPKFVAGHGVWLSDSEYARLSKAGATVSVCPVSNLFLGSGLFRLGRATDPNSRVRLVFGTDMGGGNRFSMLSVLDQMYKVGMCNNTMLDGSLDPSRQDDSAAERNKLNAYRAFYSLTLGGAQGLYLDDKIGNFEPGKEADFVVLDWKGGPPATAWHQSLICDRPTTMDQAASLLFGVYSVGDDRAVDETWIYGKRQYKKGK